MSFGINFSVIPRACASARKSEGSRGARLSRRHDVEGNVRDLPYLEDSINNAMQLLFIEHEHAVESNGHESHTEALDEQGRARATLLALTLREELLVVR
jgi:hypothetical protein